MTPFALCLLVGTTAPQVVVLAVRILEHIRRLIHVLALITPEPLYCLNHEQISQNLPALQHL